jgi:hypothetical protein
MSQPPLVNPVPSSLADIEGFVTLQFMDTLTLNHNVESQRRTLNMDLSHPVSRARRT